MREPVYYRFGGYCIAITGLIPPVKRPELLEPFAVQACIPDCTVSVFCSPTIDLPQSGQLMMDTPLRKVIREGSRTWVLLRMYRDGTMWGFAVLHMDDRTPERLRLQLLTEDCSFCMENVLSSICIESLLLQKHLAVLHAATIDHGGQAIVFTAPSGTGKSTQAALWQQFRGAEVINGDRILLRQTDSGECACGLPFAGSSDICLNRQLPVRAIVVLSQAGENRITRLGAVAAVKALAGQLSVAKWRREDVTAILGIAERIVSHVPVWHLACVPDESAVETLEQALRE